MAQNKTFFTRVFLPGFKQTIKMLLVALAGHSARIMLFLLALVVSGLLIYSDAWQPLREDAGLPTGVTPRNPELDEAILQTINDARVARSTHRLTSFLSFEQYFAKPAVSPTPRTSPTATPPAR